MGFIQKIRQFIKSRLISNRPISVMYGYPRGKKTWLTVYHKRRSDEWIFEWDDLFDSGRPKDWDIRERFMNKDWESGATPQEHQEAEKMLKARRL
jgi:hypothetical protein